VYLDSWWQAVVTTYQSCTFFIVVIDVNDVLTRWWWFSSHQYAVVTVNVTNLWSYKGGKGGSTYFQLVAFSCLVSWQTENFFLMTAAVGVRQNFALVLKTINIWNIICYYSTYVRKAMRSENRIDLKQQIDLLYWSIHVTRLLCAAIFLEQVVNMEDAPGQIWYGRTCLRMELNSYSPFCHHCPRSRAHRTALSTPSSALTCSSA